MPLLLTLSLLLILPGLPSFAAADATSSVQRLVEHGDRAFQRRAEALTGEWAGPRRIREANAAYTEALELRPTDLAIRVKLLKTLFFEAEYVRVDDDRRRELYERGRTVFEEGHTQLARRLGLKSLSGVDARTLVKRLDNVDQAGPLCFWGAMHWGLWAESFGKIAAVRKGAARRVRELGEAAFALDPHYEQGGALRLLGRLHHLTPRIPLITGWIDRSRALELLQGSLEIGPDDPLNRAFLAQAIWDIEHDSHRTIALLREIITRAPRADQLVEDRRAIAAARELLERLAGTAGPAAGPAG